MDVDKYPLLIIHENQFEVFKKFVIDETLYLTEKFKIKERKYFRDGILYSKTKDELIDRLYHLNDKFNLSIGPEELYKKFMLKLNPDLFKDRESLEILKNPNLLDIIDNELNKKLVGENEARKTIFMVANMRNVENLNKATDNLMVNAKSGTGKDAVTEAVFGLIPENEKEELIRTTPKVLAYTRNKVNNIVNTWKKVSLRLEDAGNEVLNDDSFKVILSAHPNKLNKAKTIIRQKVIDIEIEGKPSIIMTIADPNPKEELLRRVPVCYLDEGIEQTREILKRQAQFAIQGKVTDYNPNIIEALSKLKRVPVNVPFANNLLQIFYSSEEVILRTHFNRFIDYIKSSASLHQFQRKTDEEGFIIAERKDYDIARMMLQKTTNNILMIPLTKLRSDILDLFKNKVLKNKSVDDLELYKEIEKLNITPEWLRKQLDWLASKSFLIKGKEKRSDEAGRTIPKPIFIYSYNQLQQLEIPEWEKLTEISSITQNSSNTNNTKISSNSSINSNTNMIIEVIEVNLQELTKQHKNKILEFYQDNKHISDNEILMKICSEQKKIPIEIVREVFKEIF